MKLPVMMFGATAANNEQLRKAYFSYAEWLSIEPILEPIDTDTVFEDERPISLGFSKFRRWKWVVIGAETGNRADKIVPKKEWIMAIADKCAEVGTPVFMKESLREIVGSDFRQKFPLEA